MPPGRLFVGVRDTAQRRLAQVTADERDRFRQGVEQSLLAKVGLEDRRAFARLWLSGIASLTAGFADR